MRKYSHIYFDLDRTLWDFDTNIAETLNEMLRYFNIEANVVIPHEWIACYRSINKGLWENFEEKKISKTVLRVERFYLLLAHFGLERDYSAEELSSFFLKTSPFKKELLPGAKDLLNYLKGKYQLGIITNGFYDVQLQKLRAGGIDGFFNKVFTSDMYKVAKPNKKLFEIALKSLNARKVQSLMVGDSYEKDVQGAKNMGIDQVWYNPEGKSLKDRHATFVINHLQELKKVL